MQKKNNTTPVNSKGKFDIPKWLFAILVLVMVLRIPSFFEPYSYGDETIYLTLGEAIRQGIPLYSGVHDNKPPLLYIFAAIAGNLFWFKALLGFWSLLTIVAFWKLSQFIFKTEEKGRVVSTILFAIFTTIPLLEGNIANAELFMVGPTIVAFTILLSLKNTLPLILSSGVLLSVSTLFKVPAFFDIGAIVFSWISTRNLPPLKGFIRGIQKSLLLFIGFATPIALTFVWFYLQGSVKDYLVAAFLQNVGYLSSWRPDDVQKSFIEKNLPLLIRLSVLLISLLILYIKRKVLSKEFIFVTAWLLFSLFGVTLSERPYPHYLVQSVAPMALLIGFLAAKRNYEQVYSIFPLLLAFFVPFYFHFWHYPTYTYYARFVSLATGTMSNEAYLNSFGGQVSNYYKVARFIDTSTSEGEKIFVWGEGSQVYALSKRFPPGKYVADYHIRDFSTDEALTKLLYKENPTLFIVFPDTRRIPDGLMSFIYSNYAKAETINGVTIWKLLNPKIRGINNLNLGF